MSVPQIDDGGPAFPQPLTFDENGNPAMAGLYYADGCGMTLRDWFAGQALAGTMASPDCPSAIQPIAESAYKIADAMLLARKGGTDGNR